MQRARTLVGPAKAGLHVLVSRGPAKAGRPVLTLTAPPKDGLPALKLSERRRPAAAPASRPAAGIAATMRTRDALQKPRQELSRRHDDTKPLSTNKFRAFVFSWRLAKYADSARARLSPLEFLRSSPAARARPRRVRAAREWR